MKSTILIDANIENIRVAVVEDGRLAEFHVSASSSQRLVGNIYRGRVVNILPGMQAAFVNYGAVKNGYLSADDILVDKTELAGAGRGMFLPPLSQLKEGGAVMVQIVKDESGAKGARLTQNISLAGRFVVLLPQLDFVGISRKIEDEAARLKLALIIGKADRKGCGVIIRTAAAEAPARDILNEIKFLQAQWDYIGKAYEASGEKDLIYSDGGVAYCAIRDMMNDGVQEVLVSGEAVYNVLRQQMLNGVLKRYVKRLKLYRGKEELFGVYNINTRLEALLEKKIPLKNKAYLVFDRTEAMTVIDVNTGAFVGAESMEQTAFETNLTAAEEIARQLRLRNTGGIIVIDFVDMQAAEHRDAVVDYLKKCLKADRVKTQVLGMTALGLVEMTRKKQSRETGGYLEQDCPCCKGLGKLYSPRILIDKIREAIQKIMSEIDPGAVVLTVNPQLVEAIFDSRSLTSLCETVWQGKRIYIVPDEKLHMHGYKIQIETKNIIELPPKAMLLY